MSAVETTHALVLLIKAIGDQLNEVADLKRQKQSIEISMGLLREMCSVLPEMGQELQDEYFAILPKIIGRTAALQKIQLDIEMLKLLEAPRRRFVEQMRETLLTSHVNTND